MDIKTSVDWINSVRDSYGDSIEAVMTAHYIANQNNAGVVFHNTVIFGILSLDPEYPPTVVYQGLFNGKVWAKPLANFMAKMTRIK